MVGTRPPTRPMTAFFRFAQVVRPSVTKNGITGKEAGVEIGNRWKKLSDQKKQKYRDDASKAMASWKKKFEQYKKSPAYPEHMEAQAQKRLKKAQKALRRASNRPKRGLSAYFLFANDVRAAARREASDKSLPGVAKVVAAKWKALGDRKKEVYQKKAATAKAKYEKALTAYKETDEYKKLAQGVENARTQTAAGKLKKQKLADRKKAQAARARAQTKKKKDREATKKRKAAAKRKADREKAKKRRVREASKRKAAREKARRAKARKASRKKASRKRRSTRKRRSARKASKARSRSRRTTKSRRKVTRKRRSARKARRVSRK